MAAEINMGGLNILVVDADFDSLRNIQGIVSRLGHTVVSCASTEDAAKVLEGCKSFFDVVLLERSMPETGLSSFDLMKEANVNETPMFIVMDADNDSEAREEAKEKAEALGALFYWQKNKLETSMNIMERMNKIWLRLARKKEKETNSQAKEKETNSQPKEKETNSQPKNPRNMRTSWSGKLEEEFLNIIKLRGPDVKARDMYERLVKFCPHLTPKAVSDHLSKYRRAKFAEQQQEPQPEQQEPEQQEPQPEQQEPQPEQAPQQEEEEQPQA